MTQLELLRLLAYVAHLKNTKTGCVHFNEFVVIRKFEPGFK